MHSRLLQPILNDIEVDVLFYCYDVSLNRQNIEYNRKMTRNHRLKMEEERG